VHPCDAQLAGNLGHTEVAGEVCPFSCVIGRLPESLEKFLQKLRRCLARECQGDDFLGLLAEREKLDAARHQLVSLPAAGIGENQQPALQRFANDRLHAAPPKLLRICSLTISSGLQ